MNTFLKTYRLELTPLSPIHIGCGEDFEPTNYVIDADGQFGPVLYGFDPSRASASLSDTQKAKLTDASNRAALLAIQRFFRDNAKTFKAQADVLIPVSHGVAEKYERDVGRAVNIEASGNRVFNQLFIERTSHTGHGSKPYIPGSSFKGSIRTAMLDALNDGSQPDDVEFSRKEEIHGKSKRVTKTAFLARQDENWVNDEGAIQGEAKSTVAMEKRLLQGDFQTSPLRLLKVADLMPATDGEPAGRIMFAVNRRKRKPRDENEQQPKGITARKECILHGQYRAFVADAVLPSLDPHNDFKNTPTPKLRPTDLRQIARQSNAYNQTRLRREITVLNGRGLLDLPWKQSLEQLLAGDLNKKLENGDAFLIRLGRFGGADNKTLTGEGVASIKIMGARVDGKQQFSFESTTKTVWLAAESEHDQARLLPFGWAVVEIDPKENDLPQLKAWCEAQSKDRPDMAQLRQQFEADKQAAMQQKAEQAALAAKRLEAKKAEELAAVQRAQALANMTPQGQQIEALRQKCEDLASKMPPHGNFKHQKTNESLFQEATRLVTQALTDTQWLASDKAALADMLEQCLSKVVTPWGKEEKKKLKVTALRGQ